MPNYTDCSNKHFIKAAAILGFVVYRGKNHDKIKTAGGVIVAMVPRKNVLKRYTAKSIAKEMILHSSNKEKAKKVTDC